MSGGRTRWTKPVQHQQLARRPNNPTPVLSVMAPIGESKNPIKGGKNEKKKFGISQVFHHHGRQFHHESKEPTNRQRHTGNSLFVCSDFSLVLCFSSTFLVGFRAKVFPYIYLFCIAFGQQNDGWVSYWSIQATQSAFMGHTQNPQEQSLPRERERGTCAALQSWEEGEDAGPVCRPGVDQHSKSTSQIVSYFLALASAAGESDIQRPAKETKYRAACVQRSCRSEWEIRWREKEREEEGRKKKEALGRLLLIRRRRSESFRGPGEFRQCSNSSAARIHTDHSVISLFPSYTLYVYIYIYHVTCHLCRSPSPFL